MVIQLSIVIVYVLLLLLISWYSTKRVNAKDTKSFLFANKQLPWMLVSVMLAGAAVGGSSTIGIAENAYTSGISAAWYTIASAAAPLMFAGIVLKKLLATKFVTPCQLFMSVFGKFDGYISVAVSIIFMFGVSSLQIIAGGAILTGLLPDYFTIATAMLVSVGIFAIIAFIGGFYAASASNLVNMSIIYLGLIVGVIASISHFGGFEVINMSLPAGDWYHPIDGIGLSIVISWIIIMFFNSPPNQLYFQASVSARDYKTAKKGLYVAAIITAPIGIVSALYGIIAASQFPGLESAALALPVVITQINPVIAGITLAGLWAASISTGTGILVGMSTIILNDFICTFKPDIPENKKVALSKGLIVGIALLGYFVALNISSILGFLMQLSTILIPYAILVIGVLNFPDKIRKSSCFFTVLAGVAILVLWTVFPQIRIVDHVAYLIVPASIIAMVLCYLFDKRGIDARLVSGENKAM